MGALSRLKTKLSSRRKDPSPSAPTGNNAAGPAAPALPTNPENAATNNGAAASAAPSSEMSQPEIVDMWQKADAELRKTPKHKKMLEKVDTLLAHGCGEPLGPVGSAERRKQMLDFTKAKIDASREAAKEAPRDVMSIVKSVLDWIDKSKDLIGAAAKPCLPASIACAGVMLLVSAAISGIETRKAFYRGMESLSLSIYHISQYEQLLWHQQQPQQPYDEYVEELLTTACSNILLFQARAARYLEAGTFTKGLRDILNADSWTDKLEEICDAEKQVKDHADLRGHWQLIRVFEGVDELLRGITAIKSDLQGLKDSFVNIHHDKVTAKQQKEFNTFLQALRKHTYAYLEAKNRNRKPVDGTCKWFVKQEKFTQWNEMDTDTGDPNRSLLYVTADPGCGKSVLARHLVDTILPQEDRTVCYSFFKDDFLEQRTAISCVCALLHQILSANQSAFVGLWKILEAYRGQGDSLFHSFDSIWSVFLIAAGHLEVVCVLDALDECRSSDERQLLDAVNSAKSPSLRFLLTSRPYNDIRRTIQRGYDFKLDRIHIKGDEGAAAEEIVEEIKLVSQSRIDEAVKVHDLTPEERRLLEQQIYKVSNRTYLWITLVFDGLMARELNTKQDIMNVTNNLPQGIDAAYEQLLAKSKDRLLSRKLLCCIIAAKVPLNLDQMSTALVCEDQESWEDILEARNSMRHPALHIRNLCGLFVSIVDNKVYLLHQTAREFLLQSNLNDQNDLSTALLHTPGLLEDIGSHLWKHSIRLPDANARLARICMHVVGKHPDRDPTDGSEDDYSWESSDSRSGFEAAIYQENPQLIHYASLHWPLHYRQSSSEFRNRESIMALPLCSRQGFSRWALRAFKHCHHEYDYMGMNLPDALYIASTLGLKEPVGILLREPTNASMVVNISVDTALLTASFNGYEQVVQLLLSEGKANVDHADKYGRTALIFAARLGHKDVVQLLLSEGKANVDHTDKDGRTALIFAAQHGHKDVVQLLLSEGKANVDYTDKDGWTALIFAAQHGHKDVVQLLLSEGKANVDHTDKDGWTALILAAQYVHKDVVQHLLSEGKANVDHADNDGRTALMLAARYGHKDVVQLLLSEGKADVDHADKYGRTALMYARDYEGIVRFFPTHAYDARAQLHGKH